MMPFRTRSAIFIDYVIFDITSPTDRMLNAVLKDEYGSICSRLDTSVPYGLTVYRWNGLNDLPYGVYTLEVNDGGVAQKTKMIKRI